MWQATFSWFEGSTPDFWTAIFTCGLLIAAVVSARIAWTQFQNWKRDRTVERTLAILDAWFEKQGDSPSPDDCYDELNRSVFGTVSELKATTITDTKYRTARSRFITLHNYFEHALVLVERGIIDLELFLFRHQNIIRSTWLVLKPYYVLFTSQEGLKFPRMPLEELDEVLARSK